MMASEDRYTTETGIITLRAVMDSDDADYKLALLGIAGAVARIIIDVEAERITKQAGMAFILALAVAALGISDDTTDTDGMVKEFAPLARDVIARAQEWNRG